jgi:hypothetical protein
VKTITLVGSLLSCVFSLEGQVTARVSKLPNGSNRITIRNDGAIPLVAYAVAANVRGRDHLPVIVYSDLTVAPLLQDHEISETLSIWCGDSGQLLATNARDLCELDNPRIGGVLANGLTIGDPLLVTRMLYRRHSTLLALDTTLNTLSEATRLDVSIDQIIREFTRMADSLRHQYLFPEQESAREIYQDIAGKLINLAKIPSGSPFSAFVAEQSGILKQERSALYKSQPILPTQRWPRSIISSSLPHIE